MSDTEYKICQRRGHESSGVGFSDNQRTWSVCRWCGIHYATETTEKVIEKPGTIPEAPGEKGRPE